MLVEFVVVVQEYLLQILFAADSVVVVAAAVAMRQNEIEVGKDACVVTQRQLQSVLVQLAVVAVGLVVVVREWWLRDDSPKHQSCKLDMFADVETRNANNLDEKCDCMATSSRRFPQSSPRDR